MMRCLALAFSAGILLVLVGCGLKDRSPLTTAQIVENSIAAQGGEEAWHKIHTMVWVGHIEGKHVPVASMPFALEMKRPNKTRFEIRAQHQVLVRLFDGVRGWSVRPSRRGRPRFLPFTKEEVRYARDAPGIGGELINHNSSGVTLVLEGIDRVEGRKAYRLRVEFSSGARRHVWLDARTFLEIKSDRESRNAFGQRGIVSVYYRDYRAIHGLKIPFRIESGTDRAKGRDIMIIERVVLNPSLPDWVFAKPAVGGWRHSESARTGAVVSGSSHTAPPVPGAAATTATARPSTPNQVQGR